MNVVRMQGGLGNQLFGLAFARSLAILTGDPVMLDTASYGSDRYGKAFLLQDLATRIGGLSLGLRPVRGQRLTSFLMRALPFNPPGHVPEPQDAELALLAGRRGYFDGYWQNEAYIHQPNGLVAQVRDFVAERSAPRRSADVVLHYRTYKEENHPARSRAPGRAYFVDSIAHIERELGPLTKIDLISDDPDLALERLGDLGREVAPVSGGGAYDDMALLMDARALILTNSSFSWWGGYCGRAKSITYPARGELFHYPVPARRFVCL